MVKARFVIPLVALLLTSCNRRSPAPWSFEPHPRPLSGAEKAAETRAPELDVSSSGMLSALAVYDDGGNARLGYAMSHDGGDSFMPLIPVSAPDVSVQTMAEADPTLAIVPTAIYAFWEQSNSAGQNDLMLARSLTYGFSFDKPVRVNDSETAYRGFSSVGAAPNGDVYAVWLDARDESPSSETFAIYLARSGNRGASFEKNRRIALSACPCCRPRVAFGEHGEVYVVWRKVLPGDIRDIVVSTSRDGGETFSPEVRVADDGWKLRGCPHSGPSAVVSGGRLYVAWHTEGRDRRPRIELAWSDDQGAHFHAPITVSSGSLDPNHPTLGASEDGRVLVAFQARVPKAGNSWGPSTILLAETQGDHASVPKALPTDGEAAYPRIAVGTGGRVYLAWTQHSDRGSRAMLLRGRRDDN